MSSDPELARLRRAVEEGNKNMLKIAKILADMNVHLSALARVFSNDPKDIPVIKDMNLNPAGEDRFA